MQTGLIGLKGLMRERGLTYRVAALRAGMGVNTLCNKINGKSAFTAPEMEALAMVLGIPSGHIVRYFFPGMDRVKAEVPQD